MWALVALVLWRVEVQTCNEGRLRAVMCLARDWAYMRPLGDKGASPPIFPNTLNSLSPCCNTLSVKSLSLYNNLPC